VLVGFRSGVGRIALHIEHIAFKQDAPTNVRRPRPCIVTPLRAYEDARRVRVDTIARYAIAQTGRYYKDKDDDANPFVVNDAEMFQLVVGYNPEPVPARRPKLPNWAV